MEEWSNRDYYKFGKLEIQRMNFASKRPSEREKLSRLFMSCYQRYYSGNDYKKILEKLYGGEYTNEKKD